MGVRSEKKHDGQVLLARVLALDSTLRNRDDARGYAAEPSEMTPRLLSATPGHLQGSVASMR
jgi:hypothetical protein